MPLTLSVEQINFTADSVYIVYTTTRAKITTNQYTFDVDKSGVTVYGVPDSGVIKITRDTQVLLVCVWQAIKDNLNPGNQLYASYNDAMADLNTKFSVAYGGGGGGGDASEATLAQVLTKVTSIDNKNGGFIDKVLPPSSNTTIYQILDVGNFFVLMDVTDGNYVPISIPKGSAGAITDVTNGTVTIYSFGNPIVTLTWQNSVNEQGQSFPDIMSFIGYFQSWPMSLSYICPLDFIDQNLLGIPKTFPPLNVNGKGSFPTGGGFKKIWSCPTDLVIMDTAYNIIVSSTNVNDIDGTGTGARKVKVIGVDNNFDYQEEEIAMNGLTGVTTTKQFRFVNKLVVTDVGDDFTNAGHIYAGNVTENLDGTNSQPVGFIEGPITNDGVSVNGFWCVENGYNYIINEMEFSCLGIGTDPAVGTIRWGYIDFTVGTKGLKQILGYIPFTDYYKTTQRFSISGKKLFFVELLNGGIATDIAASCVIQGLYKKN